MTRKLVAALACRVQGTRLYGKPLQNLAPNYTILDHIITCIKNISEIDEIILGISEGTENLPFIEISKKHDINYILGDQKDVMWRLIQCGRAGAATDIFRITSECPFTIWELLPEAWALHTNKKKEVTAVDGVPEGTGFEIYSQAAIERAWSKAAPEERSEYVNSYLRRNQDEFKIGIISPDTSPLNRMDIRLTVDYPEDLVLCRQVYSKLKSNGPLIPIANIIKFCDDNPETYNIVGPYSKPGWVWKGANNRTALCEPIK